MSEHDQPAGGEGVRARGTSVGVDDPIAAAADARTRVPLRRRPALAWTVAAIAAVAAVAFALAWAPLYADARARDEVRRSAQDLLLHVTTFEGATIDEWVQETQRLATDDYAEEVNALFDAELRAALREGEARSVGRVVNLFVQDVDGDTASVFAVLRQTITNAATPTPVEDELRMQVDLRRVDGTWKAAKVEVLGPQSGPDAALPSAEGDPEAAEEGDG